MPTFRDKVADFLRQLSSGSDKNADTAGEPPCTSPTSGTFIQKYLNGEVKKTHPDILCGKSCYDLPVREVAPLSRKVIAAYTGPDGGLVNVNKRSKAIDFPDADVDFIDEDYNSSSENIQRLQCDILDNNLSKDESRKENKSQTLADISNSNGIHNINGDIKNHLTNGHITDEGEEIAGIKDWNCPHDNAYGMATTLYECHPVTKENAGEPIADAFAICMRENSAIMCLADGVNWGEKSCLAARCAVHGCMDYLNKALYHETAKIETTMDIFVCLLRSFHAAHNLILQENGMLTTLCAAVVCQLQGTNKFIVCTCNVGDSLAYVYSRQCGVREITQGSHDIYSMRDMRDALGALGPVDGQNPELNNLTVAMTTVEPGDIVFITSDGVSDNFDPVVGKFAIPKKTPKSSNNQKTPSSGSEPQKTESQGNKTQGKQFKRLNSQGQEKEPSTPSELILPMVEAHQRHELTLLRMEDLLNNGVNEGDGPCESAQTLCTEMIDFATKLTVAKRRILEDPDLYVEGENAVSQSEQRMRRRRVGEKLAMVPGKLDHASVVAYKVGLYPNGNDQPRSSRSRPIPLRSMSRPCETPTYDRDQNLMGTPLSSSAPVQYSIGDRIASSQNHANTSSCVPSQQKPPTPSKGKSDRKAPASRPKSLFRSSSMTNSRPFAALKQNIRRISTPTQNFRGILTPTENRLSAFVSRSGRSTPTQNGPSSKVKPYSTSSSNKNSSFSDAHATKCSNVIDATMTNGNDINAASKITGMSQMQSSAIRPNALPLNPHVNGQESQDYELSNLESRI